MGEGGLRGVSIAANWGRGQNSSNHPQFLRKDLQGPLPKKDGQDYSFPAASRRAGLGQAAKEEKGQGGQPLSSRS